jgi:hypothetical protein
MVTIFGVKLLNRVSKAIDFQSIITKYGCSIKTRIGLHEVADGVCSPSGVILLEFIGKDADDFEKEVAALGDVQIQKMVF